MRSLDDITGSIVETSIAIHRDLGPALLESIYESVLERALIKRGFRVEHQVPISFQYDGMSFNNMLRVDLLVDREVVVELKSVEALTYVHHKQVQTYLRLLDLRVGLLINFAAPTLKSGLHRIVNHLDPTASPSLRVNRGPENPENPENPEA